MSILEIKDLKKTYITKGANVEAVKGVSFYVNPGEVYGLLGPNGAGKTSVISCITTLEKPTSGDVIINGQSVLKNPNFTKKQVGIVPQEVIPHGFFNLVEILKFHSGYYGIWKNQERIDYILKRLSLWDHREKQVKQLSGGMKRRMMIAKALVHNPKVLLLDEPTAGVDVELRKSLWEFVKELREQGMAILLTTHYLQEAEEMCDRIGIINKGSLIYNGKTSQAIHELTMRTVEIQLKSGDKQSYQIPCEMGVGELLIQKNIRAEDLQDIKTREGTLEEAFLSVTSS
jgi:ABC-2 type transport system ATP-binding protein